MNVKIFHILIFFSLMQGAALAQSPDVRADKLITSETRDLRSDTIPHQLDVVQFKSNNIVFLLDISNSMARENKMPLLRKSMEKLLVKLRKIDKVHLITFGNNIQVLYSTSSLSTPDSLNGILRSVRSIASATNINGGIQTAYEISLSHFLVKGNNEMLIVTDGEFVLNRYTIELVKSHPEIKLTVVLVGEKAKIASAANYIQTALKLPVVSLITDDMDLEGLATHIEKNAAKD
jgi:Mg-chelatase subunit ChlD